MKLAKVKLSKEEILSLYHFHMDIAEDTNFVCKSDHSEKVAKDREKRAKRFRNLLKKEFKFKIEKPVED